MQKSNGIQREARMVEATREWRVRGRLIGYLKYFKVVFQWNGNQFKNKNRKKRKIISGIAAHMQIWFDRIFVKYFFFGFIVRFIAFIVIIIIIYLLSLPHNWCVMFILKLFSFLIVCGSLGDFVFGLRARQPWIVNSMYFCYIPIHDSNLSIRIVRSPSIRTNANVKKTTINCIEHLSHW